MIFAETERLLLRTLKNDDLPRLCELANDWDVAKWLPIMPHPYKQSDGEFFISAAQEKYKTGEPEAFAISFKDDGLFIGGIGLHQRGEHTLDKTKVEVGYWLGRPYWQKGIMSEAIGGALSIAFGRPEIELVWANTHVDNVASQKTLKKAGFKYMGTAPRPELPGAVRQTSKEVTCWEIHRPKCLTKT